MVLISKAGFLKLIRYGRFNLNASVFMVYHLPKNESDGTLLTMTASGQQSLL